jgi:branched-chain amino acid aminotransferase
VLAANRLEEARLRLTVTGGPAPLGSDRGEAKPTALVAASSLPERPPVTPVATVPWSRNEGGALAGLKTISYGENVRALAYATARGAGEAIFPNTRGNLCEGTGTNVFLVTEGTLVTPPESSGCLLGVTRALVLELAVHLGIPVAEADVAVSALAEADEAFITSSTREVQPVSAVDGRPLPSAPGPVTAKLADAFSGLVVENRDP